MNDERMMCYGVIIMQYDTIMVSDDVIRKIE